MQSVTDADDRCALSVTVTGTVQGVGFRPFVAGIADEYGLGGSVRNTREGVEILFEGRSSDVESALETVRTEPPSLADIDAIRVEPATTEDREEFSIRESDGGRDAGAIVPPDTAICEQCLSDIRDPESRFHGYWATGCVECGPRFSVVDGLPYDRERTTLREFDLCEQCRADYGDPTDRRFHAQTIACPDCGPSVSFVDSGGARVGTGPDAIAAAATRIEDGDVVGVKGAGGGHVTCDATDSAVVDRLRRDLDRPAKPLAVMAPSVGEIRSFAAVGRRSAEALRDRRRPIVVVPGDEHAGWLDAVSPGLHTVGAMLPYSGLHHLLFDRLPDSGPIVMTSANTSGEQMATTSDELRSLDAVDGVLVHDRPVANRCDDSVVRVVNGDRRFLRRSRGWVPRPLPHPCPTDDGTEVLAVGAGYDVTAALTRDDRVYPTQHLGDVEGPDDVRFHRSATDHLSDLLDVTPDVIAHDRHPDLPTTELAAEFDGRQIAVDHHHAHAAALLGEHDRDRAIVIAADGTGYGPDGTIRGGEVLDATPATYRRVGGLGRFRLPGGEAAVERPGRTLASLLDRPDTPEVVADRAEFDSVRRGEAVRRQVLRDVNSPPTTSVGRLLDAISALLDVGTVRRYQGEPALRLEAAASRGSPLSVAPPVVDRDGQRIIDPHAIVDRIATLADNHSTATVAATAQRMIADGLAEVAIDAASDCDVPAIGVTGGVAYNAAIDHRIRTSVEAAGYDYLGHNRVPPGDAGLSYGQAIVASARIDDEQ